MTVDEYINCIEKEFGADSYIVKQTKDDYAKGRPMHIYKTPKDVTVCIVGELDAQKLADALVK